MDNTVKRASRTVSISEEVLAKVASLAAKDVDGVVRLSGSRGLFGSGEPVKIQNLGGAISVSLGLIVNSSSRAVAVAKQVQQAVKQGIQDMTGVTAVHVNVRVTGIEAGA